MTDRDTFFDFFDKADNTDDQKTIKHFDRELDELCKKYRVILRHEDDQGAAYLVKVETEEMAGCHIFLYDHFRDA